VYTSDSSKNQLMRWREKEPQQVDRKRQTPIVFTIFGRPRTSRAPVVLFHARLLYEFSIWFVLIFYFIGLFGGDGCFTIWGLHKCIMQMIFLNVFLFFHSHDFFQGF
jgi:hypothetical protein